MADESQLSRTMAAKRLTAISEPTDHVAARRGSSRTTTAVSTRHAAVSATVSGLRIVGSVTSKSRKANDDTKIDSTVTGIAKARDLNEATAAMHGGTLSNHTSASELPGPFIRISSPSISKASTAAIGHWPR